MKIAPIEIRNADFPKVLRGFDPQRVRSFMETIADQMEELLRENIGLSERIKDLDSKVDDYRRMENIMKEALMTAQRTTEELKRNAEKEAEMLIRNAKLQAEKMLEETREELKQLEYQIRELQAKKRAFIIEFKSMLETHDKWLETQFEKAKE